MKQFIGMWMVCLMLAASQGIAGEKLRIANSGDYPPYYFYDEKGGITGFDVDISTALCKAMNMECEIVVVPWDGIIDGLAANKYDAIIASMTKTPEREKLIDFTDCYSRSSASFVGRLDSDISLSPEGLKGKKLAAVKDSYQQEYLEKKYKDIAVIKVYDNIDQTLEALGKGDVDLVLDDSLVLFYFLKKDNGKTFDLVGDPLPADDPSNSAYIGVRKGDEKLKNALNQALKTIRLDGTYSKIGRKYFPYSTY